MHEPFEPQCSFCARFVRCFPDSSPLAEWGYCLERVGDRPPDEEALKALERTANAGAYGEVLTQASDLGLYQETDDGCERFQAGLPTGR
jgi:hypothetical protein